MSEMKRAAKALVEHRTERFESRHPLAESKARLDAAIAKLKLAGASRFRATWIEEDGKAILQAEFLPRARTQAVLTASSAVLSLLVLASAWLIYTREAGTVRYLVPLFTGLSILAFPFMALALSSNRAAEESRIRKAIRVALLDEQEKFPAPQRWKDED
jgi:hypothetical protein